MSSLSLQTATAAFLVLTACASENDAADGTLPPTPETLFGDFSAASPGELRVVWHSKQTQPNGTVEIRMEKTPSEPRRASRTEATLPCSPVARSSSRPPRSTQRRASSASRSMGSAARAPLSSPRPRIAWPRRARGFQKQEGNLIREVSLPANTYDSTIVSETLSMSVGEAKLNTTFTKIGE